MAKFTISTDDETMGAVKRYFESGNSVNMFVVEACKQYAEYLLQLEKDEYRIDLRFANEREMLEAMLHDAERELEIAQNNYNFSKAELEKYLKLHKDE